MADWTGATTGAITGATTGFSIGGPIGGAVGGIAGGAAGLFGKKKKKKISTFDKRQKELNKQQYKSLYGEGPLADLYNYDPEAANAVFDRNTARKAHRDFAENTVPAITGAFRSNGLQNSSYVGDSLSKAGRDVQENLDALRSEYLYNEQKDARNSKRGAVENLQNRSTFALDDTNPFNISSILNSLPSNVVDQFKQYFAKSGNTTTPVSTSGVN